MTGAVERSGRCSTGGVGIGMGGADDAHRRGRAVLLVIGMQDEQHIERVGEHRIGLEMRLGHLPHHRQEVGAEVEVVVRVDEGHADAVAMGARRDGGHLGDQADDLLVAALGAEDVLGIGIEGRQCSQRGHEDPHGVGVMVEALHEPLAHVLMDERVIGDVVLPRLELLGGGQFPVDEQIGDLEIGGLLGQLFDGVAAIAQDAVLAVEFGDGTGGGRGGAEGGIVEPDARQELRPLGGVDATVGDRNLYGFAGAVVGDGHSLRHAVDPSGVGSPIRTRPIIVHRPFSGPMSVGAPHSGELSWFRGRRCSRLSSSTSRAAASSRRVSAGSITASMSPRSAAM